MINGSEKRNRQLAFELQGCLPFDRKFRKFRMEGKWSGHLSEIPTEN